MGFSMKSLSSQMSRESQIPLLDQNLFLKLIEVRNDMLERQYGFLAEEAQKHKRECYSYESIIK